VRAWKRAQTSEDSNVLGKNATNSGKAKPVEEQRELFCGTITFFGHTIEMTILEIGKIAVACDFLLNFYRN